ncbi:MAG TPA: dihydrolipoyl dehydrogenase [Terriglobales bacterium]|nr:dihydrolipoyl dehydrogenase [Terriglobales bacterium]
MPDKTYDVAIIGSGPAGYTAAIRAGQWGLSVALIEKDSRLGGTCLLVGCIPTKALLFNAEVYDHIKSAAELGLELSAAAKVNWPVIQQRKDKIVTKHTKGLEYLMRKNKVDVISGYGRLTGPAQNGVLTVEVSGAGGENKSIKARNVIVSTGSSARMLPGLEPDSRVLTNIEILAIKDIPKSLIIVGAGAVGVEFASIYRSFDAEVTILEMLPRVVPVEDEDISKELARAYRKRGINFHTSAKVEKVEKTKSGVAVTFTADGKQQKLEAEKILIAVGRKPNTENIGLEKVPRVQVERGFIKVNEWMQTGEPGIYAVGDIVAGLPQLAHSGMMEGIVAVATIAGKPAKPVDPLKIPNCTYCEPQIGSVGLSEAKAKERGIEVKIGKFPFTANSKASILGKHEGFIKVVADAKYEQILGVHIIGPSATDLIAESVAAMELEATAKDLMWTIHPHPTLSEAMGDAASSVENLSINI